MNIKDYQEKAIKTESVISNITFEDTADEEIFMVALKIFISSGNILDQFKKHLFYGRELDYQRISDEFALIDLDNQPHPGEFQNTDLSPRVFHSMIGCMTEAAEIGEALFDVVNQGNTIDLINVQEEMIDFNWYEAIFHDATELSWEEGLDRNIQKLQDKNKGRFKTGEFTQDEAIERDTDAERDLLEGKE